ncbi:MAG TPA: DUF4290 domain-containing protein [Moheibacter sp.]|nr:DUF4290 domain-containing protein [Moheibacter sp.]
MEYNTTRTPIIIPEYGRHVQEMVNYCLTLEDEKDRNQFAAVIIDVLGELNPHLRDVPDFQHKLWDQLFIISDFKLKVDSPYPIPTKEDVNTRPNRVPYPKGEYKYKYYGKNIREMIEVALSWEGDKQEGLIMVIANHMKKCYLLWNRDTVDDATIYKHLYELSNQRIDLRNSEETLISSERILQSTPSNSRNHQNNQNQRRGRNNNNNNNRKQQKHK